MAALHVVTLREYPGHRSGALFLSCVLHAAILVVSLFASDLFRSAGPRPSPKQAVSINLHAPRLDSVKARTTAMKAGAPRADRLAASRQLASGDERSILEISDDPSLEIVKLLRRLDGFVGFGWPDDAYLSYVFRASDGLRVRQDEVLIKRTGAYWPLLLSREGNWPLISTLRGKNGLSQDLVAYALFPADLRSIVDEAILQFSGITEAPQVEHAVIAFDASLENGFRIIDVKARK